MQSSRACQLYVPSEVLYMGTRMFRTQIKAYENTQITTRSHRDAFPSALQQKRKTQTKKHDNYDQGTLVSHLAPKVQLIFIQLSGFREMPGLRTFISLFKGDAGQFFAVCPYRYINMHSATKCRRRIDYLLHREYVIRPMLCTTNIRM